MNDPVLEAVRSWSADETPFALATVVGVRGSTYRGLAARQLVGADGTSVGTVSGGCLDGDLREIAGGVIESGAPRVVEFDLTADDEAVWGWGVGCNGATRLLVEPGASAVSLIEKLSTLRASQRPAAVVHMLDGPAMGSRVVVTHRDVDGDLPRETVREVRRVLLASTHRLLEIDGVHSMIEVVGSPSRLIVCGAGHDAVPVVRQAAALGFEVTVVDDRRQFLTQERFSGAATLVRCEPSELATSVVLDGRSFVVLMSHNYLRDLDYLRSLLGTDVAYIGSLGPGERLARLLADLRAAGDEPSAADLSKLHGPAGLDIGAEGPEEIAWAILAEILAVRRGKTAGFLQNRKGPPELRDQAKTVDQSAG